MSIEQETRAGVRETTVHSMNMERLQSDVAAALTDEARRKPDENTLTRIRTELLKLNVPTKEMLQYWHHRWKEIGFNNGDTKSTVEELFLADLEFIQDEILPRMNGQSAKDAWKEWRKSMNIGAAFTKAQVDAKRA